MKDVHVALTDAEFERVEHLATELGKEVPALLKEIAMQSMNKFCTDYALYSYEANVIGLKAAWIISGLEFHEFLDLLGSRNIEPNIPDEMVDEMIETVKSLRFEDMFPGKSKEELRKLVIDFD
jgi:hypothetical protein